MNLLAQMVGVAGTFTLTIGLLLQPDVWSGEEQLYHRADKSLYFFAISGAEEIMPHFLFINCS